MSLYVDIKSKPMCLTCVCIKLVSRVVIYKDVLPPSAKGRQIGQSIIHGLKWCLAIECSHHCLIL